MDFDQLRRLGERVESAWARKNYREDIFPELAVEALASTDFGAVVDFDRITSWVLDPRTGVQDPAATFGDLPIVAHTGTGFVIQVLVWTSGTADIHQHAFSGAFRVHAGSSLHSRYTMTPREHISRSCMIVELALDSIELLRRGDVRTILSGAGLTHAAFHLDQPSVTIVVRTQSEPWAAPQYVMMPPNIAIAMSALRRDGRTGFLEKTFKLMNDLKHPELHNVMEKRLAELDFPRACRVVYGCHGLMGGAKERILGALRTVHGAKVDHLAASIEELERVETVKRLRKSVTDPDPRFLLAALLVCRSRAHIRRLVGERYPGTDPNEKTHAIFADLPPLAHHVWERLSEV